ncbi:MAG: glycosyltransferase family 4 protein [Candidatus Woesearchaeota archaeon]
MRLAFFAPEFIPVWGGVGVYSYELVRQLARLGIDIHVMTPDRGYRYSEAQVKKEIGDNIKIHYLSTANDTFFYNIKFQAALFWRFKKLHEIHKFDLCHAANLVHMPDIFLKFSKWDIPFITTVHSTLDGQSRINGIGQHNSGLAPVEFLSRVFHPYIRFMERAYVKRTRHFICVSEWVRKLGQFDARVIHNGIDTKRFAPKKKRNEIPVVLYVGRMLAMKGIDTLIQAIKPMLEERRAKLRIIGSGNTARYASKLEGVDTGYYRIQENMPYQEMHKVYQEADIFVLPSLTESFPLSILEAMATKTAVISTDVGGIPEMVEHNKNGLLVKPQDSLGLRKAINTLVGDNALRQRLASRGCSTVEEKFTSKNMASQTVKAYEEMI